MKYLKNAVTELHVDKLEKRGPEVTEIAIGKVYIDAGDKAVMITIPIVHTLFEIWDVISYDCPVIVGSKTLWVGETLVTVGVKGANEEIPKQIIYWNEKHYYKDDDGKYYEKMMGDSEPSEIIISLDSEAKSSSTDGYFEIGKNMTGYAKLCLYHFLIMRDQYNGYQVFHLYLVLGQIQLLTNH